MTPLNTEYIKVKYIEKTRCGYRVKKDVNKTEDVGKYGSKGHKLQSWAWVSLASQYIT